ncbi:MAG: substrate-binding domain-containing protein [Clostridiales Family XIII bacterium]|jgi:ABC-type sugar transport system substrate-binding protein|nr:substrate-binding domain-containing protein [Clostridiales Family XIII bacterium]
MKKFKGSKALVMILALAMVLVFAVGCGGKDAPAEPAAPPADTGSSAPAEEPAEEPAGDVQTKTIGFYADAADSYYADMNDALQALAAQDPETDWTVDYKVGQSTADEQLKAVEDFITAGYDAIIVIQNSVDTTSECIAKAKDAGIPYFGAAHNFASAPNALDSTGSTNYDFVQGGRLAGQDALANGVKHVINIEGVLGQGSASDQSLGFLLAYEEAGKSFGEKADGSPWTAEEVATLKPSMSDIKGDYDIAVVFWASGNWMADPAQKAMTDAITSLGADGWDGAYVQNNPMTEGAINAMTDGGLSTDDYWLGSMNGREVSWQWTKDGVLSMDVNQSSCLEGALLYQMIKEYFATGSVAKNHVHPYLTGYTKATIAELEPSLVPETDVAAFVAGVNSGDIVIDINDPKFLPIPNYK